jgi:hypothetical protein
VTTRGTEPHAQRMSDRWDAHLSTTDATARFLDDRVQVSEVLAALSDNHIVDVIEARCVPHEMVFIERHFAGHVLAPENYVDLDGVPAFWQSTVAARRRSFHPCPRIRPRSQVPAA